MKRNKLGIPIVNNKDNIEGHSIRIYKHQYSNNINYFRIFKSRKPFLRHLYGINIKKKYNKI